MNETALTIRTSHTVKHGLSIIQSRLRNLIMVGRICKTNVIKARYQSTAGRFSNSSSTLTSLGINIPYNTYTIQRNSRNVV